MNEQWVTLSHGRTRYLSAGDGEPVLLLHGAGFVSGAHSWLPVISGLADNFHVVAPDMLGWGPGDQLTTPYSFGYLVDFVREFQDALGLNPASVVGHSMGGWIAALLAYESPERVGDLIIVAGGGLATRQLASMTQFQAPTRAEIDAGIGRLGLPAAETARISDELESLASDDARIERFRGLMQHMSTPENRVRYNLERRLPMVSSPTLVLWGTADEVNELSLGQRTVELIPKSELVTFPGAGHSLVAERPAEVVSSITTFLSRV